MTAGPFASAKVPGMVSKLSDRIPVSDRALWPWWALLISAVGVYFFGLGSPYAPTNGDEMVYIHIARLTAASGHWLPLVSDLENMRNTKPPLLFWQAMASGDWSAQGGLFSLRWPSVAYSLLTTAALGCIALRISGQWRTALLASIVFLAFFSTYRYSRVYLTSAPETFWLALPLWYLLWQQSAASPSARATSAPAGLTGRWPAWACLLAGLVMGVGLLYKSFALIAPAAATLGCALWLAQGSFAWKTSLHTALAVGLSTVVALAVFALWFVLDPYPQAVWQEFVVGENAGKLQTGGYWQAALMGDYPLWQQALAYPENAGLLLPVALGLCWYGLRAAWRGHWRAWAGTPYATLLVWLLVWLLVFSIPSQRSARYVIPAMPAFAILLALYWDRLGRGWFLAVLLMSAIALVLLGRISWVMQNMGIGTSLDACTTLFCAALGLAACMAGILKAGWTRNSGLAATLALYACFTAMTAPLAGAPADYSLATQARMQGLRIAVPNGFNGQYERFNFLLPGSTLVPYDLENRNGASLRPDLPPAERLDYLLERFDAVIWLDMDTSRSPVSCLAHCEVLAQRWHVKSRHRSGEVNLSNLWQPQEWLFGTELLIVSKP